MSDLEAAIRRAEPQRRALVADLAARRADLPLAYWRQQAHFTTPASDGAIARKAVDGGTAPMQRLMARFGVAPDELAERLEVDPALVRELLQQPRRAPLVMIDGEDAIALRDDVAAAGVETTADVLCDADRAGDRSPMLRFFRPPGFALESSVRDLLTLLWRLRDRVPTGPIPLDGIVFPKIEHAEEVDLLYGILDAAEAKLGLEPQCLKVALLVESGWAAAQLPALAGRAAPRLCALVFGLADYSADLGLPAIVNDHPLAAWTRAAIVNAAGAVGVPAIDGMTLDFPVADPALDAVANRERFLDRVALVHREAVQARDLGMHGKWVGHPAQLFAVLLAFEASDGAASLEHEAMKLEAYRMTVEVAARGATIIDGAMADRATDRHARVVLRRAVALGRFDAERAVRLGVIGADELPAARSLAGASRR